jgi:hypothetical protein
MKISMIATLAALGLTAMASQASAQQSGFTPQQLDQLSNQRQQEIGPRNYGPPVPQSEVLQSDIRPPSKLLVCMSADPWKPVYAAPSLSAPVIGETLSQVAVSGPTTSGFEPVLFGPGKTGYVPANEVRPFQSTIKPGLTCTISGIRPNGSAVFDIQ